MNITLPNLGDGISSATVLTILVKPGDTIQKDQLLLELETDKATAPIPSPTAGTIEKILIKEGDVVSTGMPIFQLTGGAPAANTPSPAPQVQASAPLPQTVTAPPVAMTTPSGAEPPTSPSVRKLALELGLDLRMIPSGQPGGRVTLEEIRSFIQRLIAQPQNTPPVGHPSIEGNKTETAPALPDFSKWGPVEHKTLSSLRKKIGQKMTESWTQIPHVTQFEKIDITDIMATRKKYAQAYKDKGAGLTVTIFALKAIVSSLKAFPQFNSSFDATKGELILKNYYNIGIAVDTENGLIVPVVKNVDQKSILELCIEVNDLAHKARNRQIAIEDLQGGSFTITNLGGLGVAEFTPIINTPEVAILALCAGKQTPVVIDNQIVSRLMMPIGLSYDHRVIDGADGARFIRHFIAELEQFNEVLLKI